jgi:hypothetical protein
LVQRPVPTICNSVDAQEKNHEFLNPDFSLLAQRLSSYLGHSSKGYTPTPVVPASMEKRYYPSVPYKDSFCPLPIAPSSVDGYALSPFSGDIPLESPGAGCSSGELLLDGAFLMSTAYVGPSHLAS